MPVIQIFKYPDIYKISRNKNCLKNVLKYNLCVYGLINMSLKFFKTLRRAKILFDLVHIGETK